MRYLEDFPSLCESYRSPFLYKWLSNMCYCVGKVKLLLLISVTLPQMIKISELQPHFMLYSITYIHIQAAKRLTYKMCGYFKLNWPRFKKNYSDILYPVFDRKQLWFVAWMKDIWIVAISGVMPAVPVGLLAPSLFNVKISSVPKVSDLVVFLCLKDACRCLCKQMSCT